MSITPTTLSAIQQAGAAIDKARELLAHSVTEHAQRVMGAIKHDPTHRDNEQSLEGWKALTQLAREVETAEQQFRTIYFAAERMVMQEVQVLPALTNQASRPKPEPAMDTPQIQDVIAKPATKKAVKAVKAKPKRKVASVSAAPNAPLQAAATAKVVIAEAVAATPALKLSKNDQKVLGHLQTVLSNKSVTRLTLQSIALGAGIPNGSSAAAMSRLIKAKKVEVDAQGQYRLV
jgi:hypothetical protein